jgi:hypothetical protein
MGETIESDVVDVLCTAYREPGTHSLGQLASRVRLVCPD